MVGLARSLPQAMRGAVIGTMTGLAYNYLVHAAGVVELFAEFEQELDRIVK